MKTYGNLTHSNKHTLDGLTSGFDVSEGWYLSDIDDE